MKVAVLSESEDDEVAIRILVDAILGTATTHPGMPPLRTRGWPAVVEDIPRVYRSLYYQTDAVGLVVVVDSDSAPLHQCSHEIRSAHPKCRLCRVRNQLAQIRPRRQVPGRAPLRTAVGIAVPCLEAWYLAGRAPGTSERGWLTALDASKGPHPSTALKRSVYGTDRPGRALKRERGVAAATQIATKLGKLEELFPLGFGALVTDLRDWQRS